MPEKTMDLKHLDALYRLEGEYWWHVSKRRIVAGLLKKYVPPPAEVLEVGVGAGGNLEFFRQMGYSVKGYDILAEAVEYCRKRGLQQVERHDINQPWPVEPGSVSAVLMLDVLEHIENPRAVLEHAHRALAPDGCIIITVPAMPWLMGPWDVMLGHHRRYTAKSLRAELEAAGFKRRFVSGWNIISFFPALMVRSLRKLHSKPHDGEFPKVSKLMNSLLLGVNRFERLMMRKNIKLKCGLSIVGVFCK